MGMYYRVPIKASSYVQVLIVDSEKNQIIYYNLSTLKNQEPTSNKVVKDQVQQVFDGYFWQSGMNR
jgi:hypothetical protein